MAGWLVSQWTTVILLNYILQPSAENRSILQCCPVQSVRRNDEIKVVLFSLFRVKKQGVTMYTYWCASKYFRISFVFFVTILCTELSLKTEVNANNL